MHAYINIFKGIKARKRPAKNMEDRWVHKKGKEKCLGRET
jgi:hypothetical protein